MKIACAKEIRGLDRVAIHEYGIPGLVLMENAGRSAVEAMAECFGDLAGRRVLVVAGPGNNGGDGLVMARHLHQRRAAVEVVLLVVPERLQGDAAVNLAIVERLAVPLRVVDSEPGLVALKSALAATELVVDAIFGTGLAREVAGRFAGAVAAINRCGRPVVAVDIPSGLDSDTGQPLGSCVQATLTVTFALAKPGQLLTPGRGLCGELRVVEIGIPARAVAEADLRLELLAGSELAGWLPVRHQGDHKGSFGHLLVLAGSAGKTGAALLCARGALRSGVGLVSLGVPQSLNPIFETALAEAMTIPLPGPEPFLASEHCEPIRAALAGKQAVAVGPGLGQAAGTNALVRDLYEQVELPLVVDADGLNILAAGGGVPSAPAAPRILTPHPGEMARLLDCTSREVQQARLALSRGLAEQTGAWVVLKGAGTVVAGPDGRAAINPTGNPGMACGGTGDVLTGLIGGLLAQGLSPWRAACLGVYLHGLAGDRLARRNRAGFGFTASELAGELPRAAAELAREREAGDSFRQGGNCPC